MITSQIQDMLRKFDLENDEEAAARDRAGVPYHLQSLAASLLGSSPDVETVLRCLDALRHVDWQSLIDRRSAAYEAEREASRTATMACPRCQKIVLRSEVEFFVKGPDGQPLPDRKWACRSCLPAVVAVYARSCAVCGKGFTARRSISRQWVCKDHRSDRYVTEESRWIRNVDRATDLGQAATLTLDQWVRTLDRFSWMCAYCRTAPLQVMEHYRSVKTHGTTSANCVPACHVCNARKRDAAPDRLAEIFGSQYIADIESWLALTSPPGSNTVSL